MGWRWVFFVNLPVGLACLALTLRNVPASPRRTDRPVDWPAQLAIIVMVALLTGVLNEAGRRGWTDPLILTGAGLCLLAAAAFLLREHLARNPAVPVPLLRSREIIGGAAIGLLFNFAFYGMIFTASLYFQHQRLPDRPGHRACPLPGRGDDDVRVRPIWTAGRPYRAPR